MWFVIHKKRIAKNSFLFLISLVVCLVMVEVGFRLFYPQPLFDECNPDHPDWPHPLFISDALLGHVPRQNGTWCLHQPDTNKKIIIHTNNKGLRANREFNYTKPANTLRILVFGDSFVWSANLADEETFSAQLENEIKKILQERGNDTTQVEIIPFGVGAYGPQQSYLRYTSEGKKYAADLVLFLFYQNDFTDLFDEKAQYPRPWVAFREENGTMAAHISSAEEVVSEIRNESGNKMFPYFMDDYRQPKTTPRWYKRFFLSHSHLMVFMNNIREMRNKKSSEEEIGLLFKEMSTLNADLLKQFEKEGDDGARFVSAAKQLSFLIGHFSQAVKHNTSAFALVNIPSVHQVQDAYLKIIADRITDFPSREKRMANYVLNETAANNSIPYVDLTKLAYEHQNKFYHRTDNHWSPRGVEVSAAYVAEQLDEQGLLKERAKVKDTR
ncbi:MAG: hypothetical protein Q7R76_03775 [Candidatus Woesearchaeota archaeon]|nr:hypothetical protein [Candidatus Woesearchaeota archaeon]